MSASRDEKDPRALWRRDEEDGEELYRDMKVWDVAAGVCVSTLAAETFSAQSFATLDSGRLACGCGDGDIRIYAP